jgi:hypothetical protein
MAARETHAKGDPCRTNCLALCAAGALSTNVLDLIQVCALHL